MKQSDVFKVKGDLKARCVYAGGRRTDITCILLAEATCRGTNALELTRVQMGRATKSAQIGSRCSTIDSRNGKAQAEQRLLKRLYMLGSRRQHAYVMGCHHTDPSIFLLSGRSRTFWCPASSILLPYVHRHQSQGIGPSTSRQQTSTCRRSNSYSGLIRLAQMPDDGTGRGT